MAIFEKPMNSARPAVSSTISAGVKWHSISDRSSSESEAGSLRKTSA